MPEPTDPLARELRELADGATRSAHGLPAADVRARGRRRGQRRVAVVAGLAALAVVSVGTVAVGASQNAVAPPAGPPTESTETPSPPSPTPSLTTQPTRTPSTPTPSPTDQPTSTKGPTGPTPPTQPSSGPGEDWIQEIPDSVVIDAGLPTEDYVEGGPLSPQEALESVNIEICDEQVLPGALASSDEIAVGYREVEYLQLRWLAVYQDQQVAATAYQRVIQAAHACGRYVYDEDYFGEWDVIPLTNKPITFVTLRGGMLPNLYDTGFSVVGLSQQGNALATVFRYGEGGGSPESMQATLDEAEAALTPIADQLCAFSAEGCE